MTRAPFTCRRALTMIEVLAVVTILSLIAGAAMVGLGSASDSARRRATTSACRQIDATARLHARVEGAMILTVGAEGKSLVLHPLGSEEVLSVVPMHEGTTIRIRAGAGQDSVVFDRRGQSADYEVEIAAPGRSERWRVCGLSGLIMEAQP